MCTRGYINIVHQILEYVLTNLRIPWSKNTHFLAEIRMVVLMCFGNKRWRSTLSKYIESVSSWYFLKKIWFECFAYFLLPKQTQKGKIKQYNCYSWNLSATKKFFFSNMSTFIYFSKKFHNSVLPNRYVMANFTCLWELYTFS